MTVGRAFLILHGLENHRPPGHWQHWLAGELRARDEVVAYPGLPDPDTRSYDRWATVVEDLLDANAGERIVVCHSLACLLWLRLAMQGRARADRLLLVSPPDPASVPAAGAS